MKECCGNCKHFKYEDTTGLGWCKEQSWLTRCDKTCNCFEKDLNGWEELTPDNVAEINSDLIVVTDGTYYKMANGWHASLSTLAKAGGYYYYVLPELKID